MLPIVKSMFVRDLDRLHFQMANFKTESNIWRVDEGVTNSAGNLALHIVGNLNAFIGAELGRSGYVRDRQAEFSSKNISIDTILKDISETKRMVIHVLDSMDESQLDETYPVVVFKEPMTTKYFLIHLTTHLAYHLGQVNYYRRLFDN